MDCSTSLPVELWTHIAGYACNKPEDRSVFMRTCKLFNYVAQSLPIWNEIQQKIFPKANSKIRLGASAPYSNLDWYSDVVQRLRNLRDLDGLTLHKLPGRAFKFDTVGKGLGIEHSHLIFAVWDKNHPKIVKTIPYDSISTIVNCVPFKGNAYIFDGQALIVQPLDGTAATKFSVPKCSQVMAGMKNRLVMGGKWGYVLQSGDIYRFDPLDPNKGQTFYTYNEEYPDFGIRSFKILSDGSLVVAATLGNFNYFRLLRLPATADAFDVDMKLDGSPRKLLDLYDGSIMCGLLDAHLHIQFKNPSRPQYEGYTNYPGDRWDYLNAEEFFVKKTNGALAMYRTGRNMPLLAPNFEDNEKILQFKVIEKNIICFLIAKEAPRPKGALSMDMEDSRVEASLVIYNHKMQNKTYWLLPCEFISHLTQAQGAKLYFSHDTIVVSKGPMDFSVHTEESYMLCYGRPTPQFENSNSVDAQ